MTLEVLEANGGERGLPRRLGGTAPVRLETGDRARARDKQTGDSDRRGWEQGEPIASISFPASSNHCRARLRRILRLHAG